MLVDESLLKVHELTPLPLAISWQLDEISWIIWVVNILCDRRWLVCETTEVSERVIRSLKVLQIEVIQVHKLDVSHVHLSLDILKVN